MIQRHLNELSTPTSEYTYIHTSLQNVSTTVGTVTSVSVKCLLLHCNLTLTMLYCYRLYIITLHRRRYTGAAKYWHRLPPSLRFNSPPLQIIIIIWLLQLMFTGFSQSHNFINFWNLHILSVYYTGWSKSFWPPHDYNTIVRFTKIFYYPV
jgi:hypothetical protein